MSQSSLRFVCSPFHSIPLANVQSFASGAQLGRHDTVLAGNMLLLLVMLKSYKHIYNMQIHNNSKFEFMIILCNQNVGRTSGDILHFSTIYFRSCVWWWAVLDKNHNMNMGHGTHIEYHPKMILFESSNKSRKGLINF